MTVSSWLMVPVWGLIQLLNALLLIFIVVPICYLFRGLSALLTLRPWRMQGKITVDPADLMWVKERAIINAFMVCLFVPFFFSSADRKVPPRNQ